MAVLPVVMRQMVPAAIMPVVIYSLLGALSTFVREFARYDENRDYILYSTRTNTSNTFDFIIVGAGSSGSILANRLSKHYNVLVLEAGGQPNPLMRIPSMAMSMTCQPSLDWMFQTIPQKDACLSLVNHRSNWPRGKLEGGSSNLNAMIYLRGNPLDFDTWADTVGDPIWKYKSVTNYYKKFEKFDDQNVNHGQGGEMNVENVSFGPLIEQFVKAGQELGYDWVDLNSYHTQGFAPLTINTKRGERWEGYSAFLEPAKTSPEHRLTVYKYATANKILIDKNNAAYGVEYVKFGNTHVALASKEVLISAGAIGSPKLLMLSGIGARKHLESLDIKVLADLPGVGQNLQDHLGTTVGLFSVEEPLTFPIESLSPSTLMEYLVSGTGPVSNSGTHAVASIASTFAKNKSKATGTETWPDIQLTLNGISASSIFREMLYLANVNPDHVEEIWGAGEGRNTFHIFVLNSRPEQKGEILLANKDPTSPPLIDPKYLQTQNDVDVTVEGIQLAVRLVLNTTVFQGIGGKLVPVPLKPCAHKEFASKAYWECFLRHLSFTLYHPCCTNAMGRKNNPNAVVDTQFSVYGVGNLRVIDTSVPPHLPTANINSIATLIGEIGFHKIMERWIRKEFVDEEVN